MTLPTPGSGNAGHRRRLLLASTVPQTAAAFLGRQAEYLAAHGWEVHLVCAPGPEVPRLQKLVGVNLHLIEMEREISPWRDARAILAWIRLLTRVRPDVVMAGTPKAALLGLMAAKMCRVPERVYLVRGLRLQGLRGPARTASWLAERLTAACARHVVCVSPTLRQELVASGLVAPGRAMMLGSGSSNGVDTDRFRPPTGGERLHERHKLGVPADAIVVGFVGRLTQDKGVDTLMRAMAALRERGSRSALLVVGGLDASRPLSETSRALLDADWVIRVGHVDDPSKVYRAMDILALPSAREGFPNVVLEAAASGLPAVVSDATGCRDSVIDGVTGLVAPYGSVEALAQSLAALANDEHRRSDMGATARTRVMKEFSNETVWHAVNQFLTKVSAT